MYKLSEELAKLVLRKIKVPEIESTGENIFLPKNYNSIGIIDPMAAIGTDYIYSIECPLPVISPELPYIPVGVHGYFLYKREELLQPVDSWMITKALIDPNIQDYGELIDVADCSIILSSDIEKLTVPTLSTMEQLIKYCPTIIDCLNL